MPPKGPDAAARAKAAFDAEWEVGDDRDLTAENEERENKKVNREVRRARKNTIMLVANRSNANRNAAGDLLSGDDDDHHSEVAPNIFPNGYQEIPLAGGGLYRGFIKNDAFDGEGEIKFSNGDSYVGGFRYDMRHGFGKFAAKNQTIARSAAAAAAGSGAIGEKRNFTLIKYEGTWVDDRREGAWGVATYSNGDTYEGPFHNNRPDTTQLLSSSSTVSSSTSSAAAAQLSKLTDDALEHYLLNGSLPDGHPLKPSAAAVAAANTAAAAAANASERLKLTSHEGKLPTYRFAGDGRLYVGQLRACIREGRGALKTRSGEISIGTFVNNLLHGKNCTVKFAEVKLKAGTVVKIPNDGIKEPPGRLKEFVGEFLYGRRLRGKLTYTDGKVYEGQWDPATEKPNGRGTCRMRCGDIYVGEWLQGKMHGRGRITYTGANAGKVYDGEWSEDKPFGRGTMLLPTGVMVECLWEQGKQIQAADQAAKVAEWESLAAASKSADNNSSSFALTQLMSAAELTAAVARWKMPLIRKTDCTVEDLPSMGWFEEAERKAAATAAASSSAPLTQKNVAAVPSAASATTSKPAAAGGDDSSLDLDGSDDDDGDIDFGALDAAISASNATKKKNNNTMFAGDDDPNAWEQFAQVEQPTEESGPSDNEHHDFLQKLRQRGFVPELLASVDDYADSDPEAEEAARKRKLAEDVAKDAALFGGGNDAPDVPAAAPAGSSKKSAAAAPPPASAAARKQPPPAAAANNQLSFKPSPTSPNNNANTNNNNGAGGANTNNAANGFGFSQLANNDAVIGGELLQKGWLTKHSIGKSFFGFGGWKTRFFTLVTIKSALLLGADEGALMYYEDEACAKHLGTVQLKTHPTSTQAHPHPEDPILYTLPSKDTHKKSDRPDLDLVIEYTEEGKRYKLLLRAASTKERDQWVMYLSRVIKQRR